MGCEESMWPLISRYVDREVTPVERHHVRNHTRRCVTCRDFLETIQRNDQLVAAALSGRIEDARVLSSLN